MKRAGLLPLLVLTLLAGCGGGGGGPKAVPADAVAIVGDQPVGRAAFDAMLAATLKGYPRQGLQVPQPGTKAYRDLRNRVLDDFVQAAEFGQQAKSQLHVEVTDDQVQQRVDQLKTQYYDGSQSKYLAGLRSQGLSDVQIRQRFRAQLLAAAVFAKLSGEATVSDDEAKAYYEAHIKGYRHPASRQVRQITVATRAQADRIAQQVRGGADFAQLARTRSTDPSSAPAGGLVTFTRGETLPALLAPAFALKTGAVSAPVHSENGWYVIKAIGPLKRESVTQFEQVKPTIEALLLQQAKQRKMTAWVRDTRAEFAPKTAYAPGFGPPSGSAPAPAAGG